MADLVVTCPKHFWREWIAEGDAAGDPATGQWYDFYVWSRSRPPIEPGERLYIVAHGRLRGYAPVVELRPPPSLDPNDPQIARSPRVWNYNWAIVRAGGAVAVTVPEPIRGFRGYRKRWWPRENEVSFPEWKTAGVA